jgi:hypothetical protein
MGRGVPTKAGSPWNKHVLKNSLITTQQPLFINEIHAETPSGSAAGIEPDSIIREPFCG